MSDTPTLAKIKLNGIEYNIKDAEARSTLDNKQTIIAINGLLKGNGNGNITAAVEGTDYITGMYIASYGNSTYAEVLAAYQANQIVYCRASSNTNPAIGNQLRMAFLAYVNNPTTPTEFEFQYYRSVATHSNTQQGDQVYVYKLNSSTGWSVTIREAYTKIVAGTNMTSSYNNGTLTLAADNTYATYTATLDVASWTNTSPTTYTYSNTSLKCGKLGTTPPIISCTSNETEYSNIISAVTTPEIGIVFTALIVPTNAIEITIIDFQ